jgi:glycosyltransferase involved in cell wall biosynthesis
MSKPLKVAIVTNSRTGGGAERAMNTLARELSQNAEFELLLIPINSGPADLIDPKCRMIAIERTWRGSLLDSIKSYIRFQRVIHKFEPEVVVLNCDLPEFLFALTISKASVIIVEHSTKSWETRPFIGKLIWLSLRWRTSAVVRVSSRINIRSPKPKVDLVISNPLPSEVISGNRTVRDSRKVRLAFIGRLSEEKDPKMFCEIAAESTLHPIIIGDGLMGSSLREMYPFFDWLGLVPNPWDLIGGRDLLILTSKYEGDGLVLLEAVANGTPLLVRDTPDFRSFNLPEINYFKDSQEALLKINQHTANEKNFQLTQGLTESLLNSRDPKKIASDWSSLILSVS